MIAARLDRPVYRLWIAGGVFALALHASFLLKLVQWHDLIPADAGSEAVLIDLAPPMPSPAETPQDLAPGPVQREAPAAPEPPKQEAQPAPEKIEPLPALPDAEAVLPKPQERPVETAKRRPVAPAPVTTAPPRPHASAAQVSNWHRQIAISLQRHKNYPAAAQARGETGAATVAFSIDRQGRVLSARIVRSSQHAALDAETLATVHRAAPFPHPPAGMPGERFDFVVPVQFNIR